VESYKDLNTAKFAVIHKLEEQLPVALFRYEWHLCGHGKDKDKYVPLASRALDTVDVCRALRGVGCVCTLSPARPKDAAVQPTPTVQSAPASTLKQHN